MTSRIALAQCAPTLGDVEANLAIHQKAAEHAIEEGADLCLFPELSLTGYLLKDLVSDVAMGLDDPRLAPLRDLSRRVDIVFGMVLDSPEFRHYNAAVHLSGGEATHVHRKVYLPTYGMFDEQRYFAAGDRVRAFERAGFRTGLLVCEDMWHLSTSYLLAVQDVSLLLCLSASPGRGVLATPEIIEMPGSVASWESLCRTVAEYNGAYVAYCNRLGFEDGVTFWGGSSVHGPDGRLLATAGEEEAVIIVDIDPREVERKRLATPLMRDERVEFTLRELGRIWDERTSGPF
jgi:NAD+ synthase (glutamine-hydrolysing)